MTSPVGDLADTAIELPERLDYAACGCLAETIGQQRGRALQLRAGRVRFLGGLATEILLRARAEWDADGIAFDLTGASKELLQGLALLGVSPGQLIPEASV